MLIILALRPVEFILQTHHVVVELAISAKKELQVQRAQISIGVGLTKIEKITKKGLLEILIFTRG